MDAMRNISIEKERPKGGLATGLERDVSTGPRRERATRDTDTSQGRPAPKRPQLVSGAPLAAEVISQANR
jgi:hypothetical protein